MPPFTHDEWLAVDRPACGVDEPLSPTLVRPPSREEAAPPRLARYRVLHLINGEHYSGAERVQDLLAQRLPDLGFDVGFACLKPGRFPEMRQARQAPLYAIPMRSRLDFRGIARLCRIVRDDGYQLLHAHTPRTALLGRLAALVTQRPLVYHVHSPTARDSTRWLQNRLNAWGEHLALAGRTRVIAVSASLGEHMRCLGYDAARVFVVPNGVPAAAPPPRNPPQGEWTLGTVALFRPRKGTEVLLEALAILRREGQPVRLRAVGPFETPEYQTRLMDLARRLELEDAVAWVGFTRDVNAELLRWDLFVLPSLFGEGLPMVVLEAMAAGVPVVGTRVEGVPEAIRDALDGALAAPGDAADLTCAIRRILSGELVWSHLRESALRRHAERFSDRSMAEGVARVYREIFRELGLWAAN